MSEILNTHTHKKTLKVIAVVSPHTIKKRSIYTKKKKKVHSLKT